jgi:hypothetical protein
LSFGLCNADFRLLCALYLTAHPPLLNPPHQGEEKIRSFLLGGKSGGIYSGGKIGGIRWGGKDKEFSIGKKEWSPSG